MAKVLLVDGNAMLFRAYYATKYTRMMSTSNGIPTNAVYGFITMLNKAIQTIQPDKILVAWDAGKPTFRHEQYEAYKGTRKPIDDELIVQFPIVREYLDAAHIARYEQAGIEADDIIGTLSMDPKNESIILTSDKDLLQCIDETTHVLLMKKGITDMKLMDEKSLMEEMQITPAQIIELKGLMGDASDNIPGVIGVGEKTALSLLKSYSTVNGVYENLSAIKGKLQEKLANHEKEARLSTWLATIVRDASVDVDVNNCDLVDSIEEKNQFFKKYEMNSLLVSVENKSASVEIEADFTHVTAISKGLLCEKVFIYCDCDQEDTPLVYGFTFTLKDKVEYITLSDLLKDQPTLDFLKSDQAKYTYNLKQLFHIAHHNHFEIQHFEIDIMIALFISNVSLTSLSSISDFYQLELANLDDIYGKKGKPLMAEETKRFEYLKVISVQLSHIVEDCMNELERMECLDLFYRIEMPLIEVLYEMEKNGIECDTLVLDEIASRSMKRIDELTNAIFECAGHEFNINSPKQLAVVLYDELGLKAPKSRSTAVDVLEKLSQVHPIVSLLMEQRKIQKLYSTYAAALPRYIRKDGRIHTTFNQNLTTTGRLSSSDPNLQNISVRDEDGKEIRKAFVASQGCVLMSADYSQIELRMLAHMANVKEMIEAFNQGVDIHTQTAMKVFHVDQEHLTSQMRSHAKAVNFGIVYGISAFGLGEQLSIPTLQAKEFIDRYFESYPNIKVFMDETVAFCEQHGYVKTLFNRRRLIPEIHDKNYMTREFGKRAAMNAPIQGSSADLIKVAMNNVYKALKERKCQSKLILQIHDELIVEVVESEVELVRAILVDEMQQAMKIQVPLLASVSIGKSWYEAK